MGSHSSKSIATELSTLHAEEAASTSFEDSENVLTGEDFSSWASYKGKDKDLGSESDTVSSESNRNLDDLYSLDDVNNFLDVTFKKSVIISVIQISLSNRWSY